MLNSKDIAVFTLFLSRKINLDLIQCWVQEIRFCNDLFPQVFCNTTLKKYCKTDKISWDEGLFIKNLSLLGKSSWDPDINPQIHMQNCALSNFNGWDTKKKLKTTGHEQSVAHIFFFKKNISGQQEEKVHIYFVLASTVRNRVNWNTEESRADFSHPELRWAHGDRIQSQHSSTGLREGRNEAEQLAVA